MVCILNLYKSNCGRKINSGHHFNARWTGLKNERAASCPQALVFPPLVGNLRNLSRCDYFLHGRRKRAQFYLSRLLIDFVYPPSRRNHATEPQPWPVWLDKSQKCRGGPGIRSTAFYFTATAVNYSRHSLAFAFARRPSSSQSRRTDKWHFCGLSTCCKWSHSFLRNQPAEKPTGAMPQQVNVFNENKPFFFFFNFDLGAMRRASEKSASSKIEQADFNFYFVGGIWRSNFYFARLKKKWNIVN